MFVHHPAEAEDLSDSFASGDEDNGRSAVSNKNISNEINGNWMSSTSNSIHEARLKAKAKRRLRKNSSRDSGRGDSLSDNGDMVRGNSAVPTSPKSKLLDRKSRLGKGRGLPKKGKTCLFKSVQVTRYDWFVLVITTGKHRLIQEPLLLLFSWAGQYIEFYLHLQLKLKQL